MPEDDLEILATHYMRLAPTQEDLVGSAVTIPEKSPLFEPFVRYPIDRSSLEQGYVDAFIDSEARVVVLSDYFGGGLELVDAAGAARGFVPLGGPPARIERSGGGLLVALMADSAAGQIVEVDLNHAHPPDSVARPILQGLERPIRAYPATMLGARGVLVEEFGHHGGGLRFFPRTDDGTLETPRVIVSSWGVVGSSLSDLDDDGDDDLLVLVSQEIEELLLFPNVTDPDAVLEPVVLFRGHPGFGFNGLLTADLNNDGRFDIITINGDNYDIDSGPLKPYHGIRIFLNKGPRNFREPIFLPFHGVVGVVVEDFNLDGRVDLLALSAFPDHRIQPYQSAVLFEQLGSMTFVPRSIEAARGSRWVAGAAADLDDDGDLDVILIGAYSGANDADRRWSRLAGPDASTLLFLRNLVRN